MGLVKSREIVFVYHCRSVIIIEYSTNTNDTQKISLLKIAYFCFITLSTIGFGDIVPGDSIKLRQDFEGSAQILFCCIYLIFGLALIAMSFNLVQEQVILKMRKICESLGMDVRRRTLTY